MYNREDYRLVHIHDWWKCNGCCFYEPEEVEGTCKVRGLPEFDCVTVPGIFKEKTDD